MGIDLKIGISGKRHIEPDLRADIANEIEKKINVFLSGNNAKTFTGYTGLASGADLIFGELVIDKFHMPLHVILPFSAQEYEKDFEDQHTLETFRRLLKRADKIHIISTDAPIERHERNDAYFKQGVCIADHCSEMIFVWDEMKPAGHGGTAEIIGYYMYKKNRATIPYIKVKPKEEDIIQKKIIREYERANNRAISKRDIFKNVWKAVIILSWLAVSLFAYKVGYHLEDEYEILAITVEFALIISVFILFTIARKNDFHGAYLKNRMKAESFRLLRCFYHSGIEAKQRSVSTDNAGLIPKFAQQINDANKHATYSSPWYTYYTIRSLIEEQISYHSTRLKRIGKKPEVLEKANVVVGVLFLVNLTIHLIHSILKYKNGGEPIPFYNSELAIFISIFLPATYAAIEGILHFQDWKILKKCSEQAEKDLKDCLIELPAPIGSSVDKAYFTKQADILVNVSHIMLTDNNNWQLILSDRNNYMLIL